MRWEDTTENIFLLSYLYFPSLPLLHSWHLSQPDYLVSFLCSASVCTQVQWRIKSTNQPVEVDERFTYYYSRSFKTIYSWIVAKRSKELLIAWILNSMNSIYTIYSKRAGFSKTRFQNFSMKWKYIKKFYKIFNIHHRTAEVWSSQKIKDVKMINGLVSTLHCSYHDLRVVSDSLWSLIHTIQLMNSSFQPSIRQIQINRPALTYVWPRLFKTQTM